MLKLGLLFFIRLIVRDFLHSVRKPKTIANTQRASVWSEPWSAGALPPEDSLNQTGKSESAGQTVQVYWMHLSLDCHIGSCHGCPVSSIKYSAHFVTLDKSPVCINYTCLVLSRNQNGSLSLRQAAFQPIVLSGAPFSFCSVINISLCCGWQVASNRGRCMWARILYF